MITHLILWRKCQCQGEATLLESKFAERSSSNAFFFADSRISTVVRGVLCNTYAYTCMWIIVVNILNAIDGNWMTYTFTYKWSNTVVRPAVERDNQFGCNIEHSLLKYRSKKKKFSMAERSVLEFRISSPYRLWLKEL